jgi:hypothetical protein
MEQQDFEFLTSVEKSYPPDIAYRVCPHTPQWSYVPKFSIHFDQETIWKQPQVFVKWTPECDVPKVVSLDCKPTEWDKWNYRTVCANGWHRTEQKDKGSWFSEPCWRTVHADALERFTKAEALIETLATTLKCQTKEVFDRIKKVDDHVYEMQTEIYHATVSRISMNCAICGVMRGWVTPLRTPIEKIAELYKLHLQGIHPEIWNDKKKLKTVILEKYL